jgi:hypothetical protein
VRLRRVVPNERGDNDNDKMNKTKFAEALAILKECRENIEAVFEGELELTPDECTDAANLVLEAARLAADSAAEFGITADRIRSEVDIDEAAIREEIRRGLSEESTRTGMKGDR